MNPNWDERDYRETAPKIRPRDLVLGIGIAALIVTGLALLIGSRL